MHLCVTQMQVVTTCICVLLSNLQNSLIPIILFDKRKSYYLQEGS